MGVLSRQYDSLGRSSGFFVGPDLASAPYAVSHAFDSIGRFSSVSSSVQSVSSVVNYSYLPKFDLPSGWSNGIITVHIARRRHLSCARHFGAYGPHQNVAL